MLTIYRLLSFLSPAALVPWMAWRGISRGEPLGRMGERFGIIPSPIRERLKGGKRVWLHAVSVGEVNAAVPLLNKIKEEYPDVKIVVSTVTATGNRTVADRVPFVDGIIFFPWDHPLFVRSAIQSVGPDLFLFMETELWPNFLMALRSGGTPALMINGRISLSSFRNYRRIKPLTAEVLRSVRRFSMQSDDDARRIVELGADPAAVSVTGNIKFDGATADIPPENLDRLKRELGLPAGAIIFTAGSTHSGEDEVVIDAYKAIMREHPSSVLIIAPRHPDRPERIREIEEPLRAARIPFFRRTACVDEASRGKGGFAVILDTYGELSAVYALSTAVLVGGSLVPVGGHNLLEPASFGKPVLFGPHMHKGKEMADLFVGGGGGFQVGGKEELIERVLDLLSDSGKLAEVGERARDTVLRNRGALARNMEIIRGYLLE